MGNAPEKNQEKEQKQSNQTINFNFYGNNNSNPNNGNNNQIKDGDVPPLPNKEPNNNINNLGKIIEIMVPNNIPNINPNANIQQNNIIIRISDPNVSQNTNNNNNNVINNNQMISPDLNIDNNSERKNQIISPDLNIDNNSERKIQNEKNFVEGNTTFGNIDNNNDIHNNNGNNNFSTNKGNIDPNKGRDNIINEEKEFTKPSNIDNNNNNSQIEIDNVGGNENNKHDLSMSQSVLMCSLQNLDINSPTDLAKIKESLIAKMNEGYFPIFFHIEKEKPIFYYIKPESNLKSLIKAHFSYTGVTDKGDNYKLYWKEKKLDVNIPVGQLDIAPLSVINLVK